MMQYHYYLYSDLNVCIADITRATELLNNVINDLCS